MEYLRPKIGSTTRAIRSSPGRRRRRPEPESADRRDQNVASESSPITNTAPRGIEEVDGRRSFRFPGTGPALSPTKTAAVIHRTRSSQAPRSVLMDPADQPPDSTERVPPREHLVPRLSIAAFQATLRESYYNTMVVNAFAATLLSRDDVPVDEGVRSTTSIKSSSVTGRVVTVWQGKRRPDTHGHIVRILLPGCILVVYNIIALGSVRYNDILLF